MSSIHAIVLAGGQGKRMGNVDKALVRVGGVRLIDAVLRQLPGPEIVTVVSPSEILDLPEGIRQVSEKPAGGGPVAGIAAAFDATCRYTMVLTVDAPHAPALIAPLYRTLERAKDADVAVVESDDGQLQHLCQLWRTPALRKALDGVAAKHGGARDVAARELIADVEMIKMPGTGEEKDYDTVEELSALGEVQVPEQDY